MPSVRPKVARCQESAYPALNSPPAEIPLTFRPRGMWVWHPANNRGKPRCVRTLVEAAFFAMALNPPEHVVAIAIRRSSAAAAKKACLQDWVMAIDKVPLQLRVVTDTVHLSPLSRIRGLDIGLDGARDTVEQGGNSTKCSNERTGWETR